MPAMRLQMVCFGLVGDFATTTSPFLNDCVFFVQNSTSTTSPSYSARMHTCVWSVGSSGQRCVSHGRMLWKWECQGSYRVAQRTVAALTEHNHKTPNTGPNRVEGREHRRSLTNCHIDKVLVETVQQAAKLRSRGESVSRRHQKYPCGLNAMGASRVAERTAGTSAHTRRTRARDD